MTHRNTAVQAARTFSEILDRVEYRGEEFIVDRGGRPVCRIAPVSIPACTVADLSALLDDLPRLDEDYLRSVERAARRQGKTPRSP